MRLAFFFSSLFGVWGGLRDDYCFGGSDPSTPIVLPPIPEGYELKSIQIVTRHGARTPLVALPNVLPSWRCAETSLSVLSPNDGKQEVNVSRLFRKVYLNHETYQQCAFGQLTVLGAQQHTSIGKGLRKSLVEDLPFLSETVLPPQVYVRSTDLERTQQSAQSLLLSLYPPSGEAKEVGKGIELMEINTITKDQETMTPNFELCPYLYYLQEQVLKTKEWSDCLKDLQPIIKILQQLLGEAPQKLKEQSDWLERAADTLSMIECHNNTLPLVFAQGDHRAKLYAAMDLNWFLLYNNSFFSELALGAFLLDLHDNFDEFVNMSSTSSPSSVSNVKFRLFSGHDTTLAPLLGALGVASQKWIPLASQLVFKLLQKSGTSTFSVRILFNGKPLNLPGCSKLECPWTEWSSKMQQLRSRLVTANKENNICFSVAVAPPCRDITTILKDYAAWWPLLVLLLLTCFVAIGCAFRIRRLQKVERFRPVEMAEISESR